VRGWESQCTSADPCVYGAGHVDHRHYFRDVMIKADRKAGMTIVAIVKKYELTRREMVRSSWVGGIRLCRWQTKARWPRAKGPPQMRLTFGIC